MTIEEQAAKFKAINNAIMTAGLLIGIWFVVEYFFTILSTSSIHLAMLRTPIMFIMPIVLFYSLYKIRNYYFKEEKLGCFRCWFYGTQIMFYAGMIEAAIVIVYNQWISPDNLANMHQNMIALYQDIISMYYNSADAQKMMPGMYETMNKTLELLKEAPIETPFEAGVTLFSNDIFYGAIWAIPFGFILNRKPKNKTREEEKTPTSK